MNSYSISVYQVTLNKRFKKDKLENLSNFDGGKDFLTLVDSMFLSWRDDIVRNVINDTENKKVSRVKRDINGCCIYHRHQTYIDGIIESGEYGTQEEIIDIKTGKAKYIKTKEDAALVPFYFMIYIEPNTQKGYLILERIGNIGILSVLHRSIREFFIPQMSEQLILNIIPYIVPQVLEMNLEAAGGAKKVILRGVNSNQFKSIKTNNIFSNCNTEVSFIAPRNKFIQEIKEVIQTLKGKKGNEPYNVNNIECQDVAFELDINGNRRTISVAKMTSIGMNIDITNQIHIDNTGYPSYQSMFEQANVIISYLIQER